MAAWYETHRAVVHPWMCDHFGHLNVRFYAQLFDDASFALWPMAGVGRAVFEAAGVHTVVAHTETDFRAELRPGAMILIRTRFDRLGEKSVHYVQELSDIDTTKVHAIQRAVEVFFDPESRTSIPIPASIRELLACRI